MNEMIKTTIDARYNSFFSAYEIKDDKIKKEIDALFKKINEFGKDYSDIQEFETAFASSPLNTEYINLFTKIASSCQPIVYENTAIKENKHEVLDEVLSDAKYAVDDITMPARRIAREEFDKKMRDTPLGKIEQVNNMKYLVGRLFKKNK